MKECYKCQYREILPGSAHSKCVHPEVKELADDPLTNVMGILASVGRGLPLPPSVGKRLGIKGNPHGIKNGWFNWPINFDPVWLENCDGFTEKKGAIDDR